MITIVVAMAKNNVIGKNNGIPWHIPEDMAHFKKITTGHTVLMGRRTWESIPEKFRPLTNRTNIIITRQSDYPVPRGVEVYSSIDTALTAHIADHIMIIGGADIYRQTIDRADTLCVTHIDQDIPGDTFFPTIDKTIWKESARESHNNFAFVTYKKI